MEFEYQNIYLFSNTLFLVPQNNENNYLICIIVRANMAAKLS